MRNIEENNRDTLLELIRVSEIMQYSKGSLIDSGNNERLKPAYALLPSYLPVLQHYIDYFVIQI